MKERLFLEAREDKDELALFFSWSYVYILDNELYIFAINLKHFYGHSIICFKLKTHTFCNIYYCQQAFINDSILYECWHEVKLCCIIFIIYCIRRCRLSKCHIITPYIKPASCLSLYPLFPKIHKTCLTSSMVWNSTSFYQELYIYIWKWIKYSSKMKYYLI